MANTTLNWGDMSPGERARHKKDKAKANRMSNPQENEGITDAGKVPPNVGMKSGKSAAVFNSVKAYNTRAGRSVFSK